MLWGLFVLAGGIFCVWAAYTRQEWFFNSPRAWLFVKLFGVEGARYVYIGLGIFLIIVSLFTMAAG
jgi:hypothetical protein